MSKLKNKGMRAIISAMNILMSVWGARLEWIRETAVLQSDWMWRQENSWSLAISMLQRMAHTSAARGLKGRTSGDKKEKRAIPDEDLKILHLRRS